MAQQQPPRTPQSGQQSRLPAPKKPNWFARHKSLIGVGIGSK
jgi:hypothetical protein